MSGNAHTRLAAASVVVSIFVRRVSGLRLLSCECLRACTGAHLVVVGCVVMSLTCSQSVLDIVEWMLPTYSQSSSGARTACTVACVFAVDFALAGAAYPSLEVV